MKKKIVLLGLMLQASSSMFAQTANSRSDINSMLSSWLIPAIGLLMLDVHRDASHDGNRPVFFHYLTFEVVNN